MHFLGLIHIWLVSVPPHMVPPFSIFQYGKYLENPPKSRNIYNYTENIVNIVDRKGNRVVGGGNIGQQKRSVFCIQRFGSILITGN